MHMKLFLSQICGLFCLLWLGVPLASAQTITTIAGTGTAGFNSDGVVATAAQLNTPYEVFVDGQGNLFIADFNNTRIRRVDAATGNIATVAGTGVNGFSGDAGPATSARLTKPTGIFRDSAGNLFIADTGNNRVRKVDFTSGDITTLAGDGTGAFGGDGAAAAMAQLSAPYSVLVDAAGNIIISDFGNDRIRKVDAATGDISTIAGTATAGFSGDGGPANLAQISGPAGMAFDAQGNLYFSDLSNNRVRKIDLAGDITTVAGTGSGTYNGDGIQATNASLAGPRGLAVDSLGRLFIADANHRRIRMVDTNGVISTYAGTGTTGFSGDGGPAAAAEFGFPSGVQVDSSGNVYVTDQSNHRIRRISAPPVGNPPGIVAQPQPISQPTGSTVAFVVTANGSLPLAYQWFFTNGPVPLANGPTLAFPAAQPTNSGSYFVVITNAFGSITSSPALLTITNSTAPPALTLQPQNQSGIVSNTVAFTASATGALPLSYQWFFNSNLLGGATSPTLTLPNVQLSAAGNYFLVVTNNFGSLTSSIATLAVLTNSATPPFQWVNTVAGTSDDVSESVKVDAAGNTYLAGFFSAPISFGNTNLAPIGVIDAFVAKYDARGICVWARSPGGRAVALDPAGNVIVSGEYFGTVNFGSTNATSVGGFDAFVVKYNNNGTLLWSRQFGAAQDDHGSRVATDAAGNIYLAGDFQLTVAFGTNSLTSAGGSDLYLVKLSPAGTVLWAQRAGGTGNDSQARVAVDASGNPVLSGAFQGTASFGTNVLTSAGGNDGFVAKYDPNGNVLWVQSVGGSGNDQANEITVDSASNIFVAGEFSTASAFGATNLTSLGGTDAFIAKYSAAGSLLRLWQVGSPGDDRGRGVGVDALGNVYLHGDFGGVLNFGGFTITNAAGSRDVFALKTDATATPLWLKRAGSSGTDTSGNLAVALNGDVFLTGSTSNNAAFDKLAFTNAGGSDIYFTKIPANLGPVPVPTGLVGWWAAEGFAVDYAWTNHGTFTNAATIVPNGQVGSAFSFDGTTSAVVTSTNALKAAYTNLTVEAWVFPTNHSTGTIYGRTVIGHTDGDGFALRLNSGVIQADLRLTSGDVLFNAGPVLPLNTWSHIAYTYDGTRLVAYLNGLAQGSILATGAIRNVANANVPLLIGHEGSGATIVDVDQRFAWAGLLDEVAVFSRALAPTEIQSVFTSGSTGKARPATPTLLTQPTSRTVDQGAPAAFSTAAVGYAPFTYQWRLNGTNVPGQTNATLTIPAAYSAQEGPHDVRVTQFDGGNVLSAPATLNVLGQGEVKTLFGTTNDVANFVRSGGGPSQWFLTSSNSIQVVPGTGNIQSTQTFGDFILHAEFLLPPIVNGNCGIFLQGRYEVQIFNSFGVTSLGSNDCGAIWGQIPPSTNACLAAGQWQSYDIVFRQAQWNGNTKITDARATVVLNGVTVQNNVALTNRTTGGAAEGPTLGPVTLQDNGTAVQFRNLRITPLDLPPEFAKAQSSGGSGLDQLDTLFVDQPGNSYIAGRFSGTAVIAGATLVSAGLQDNYVAKYGPNGNPLWVRQIGSTGDDAGYGVVAIPNGDVYTSGRFVNTANFGTTNLTSVGQSDIYLAKYDGIGTLIWALKAGGAGTDAAYAVTADAGGNAYITGDFSGTADFGGVQLTSGGTLNSFVAKYGSTGALIWAVRIGGTGTPTARRITLDSATNVYVGGSFQGTIQFVTPSLTSVGQNDGFVLKLNSSGVPQWVQQFGGTGDDDLLGLNIAPDGTINIGGSFRGTVTIGTNTLATSGGDECYVAKLDSAGNPRWARKSGSPNADSLDAMATDAQGAIYAVGTYSAQAAFNATSLNNSGTTDLFVVKYDANGNQQWVHRAGNANSLGSIEVGTDAAGIVRITGQFSGALSLDHLSLTNAGQQDIFIAALGSTLPLIIQQPIGGNVLAGQNVTFTISATGTGALAYQWRMNGTNLTGATNASYTIANAAANAAGTYDVLVTHAFGTLASSPAVVAVISSANPLPFTFAERLGGTGADSVQGLARDAAGNSYLAGFFTGTLNLGTTNLTSAGGDDLFVAKVSPAGTVLWAAHCGGPGEDRATGVALDPNGDVVVVGWFDNNAVFGTNGAVNLDVNVAAFTLRLSTDGVLTGFHKADFSGPGAGLLKVRNFAVAVDAAGAVYVAGKGDDTNNFGAFTLGRPGVWGYLVKYDRSGNVQWIQASDNTPGSSQNVIGMAVALDNSGGVYLGGYYGLPGGTSGTNAIIGGVTLPYGGGDADAFVAKFTTATGAPVWTRGLHGAGAERVMRLAADPFGNVFASGDFDAPVNLGPGLLTPSNGSSGTGLLLKLNPAGTVVWAREAGSTDGSTKDNGSLATDALGNVYLANNFTGTCILGTPSPTSAGGRDALVTKFGANGNFLWVKTFGSTGDDFVNGLVLDTNFNLHVAGTLSGQAALAPFTLTNAGSSDLFLATLATQPPIITTQPTSQSISVNQAATFSIGLTGTLPLSYQWRFNGTNLPNATNATFTIANVIPASAGSYSVLVGDALGIAVSASATLTVDTSGVPFVTVPPQSQTVQQGIAVLFNVGAVGAQPLTYQWRKNGTNLAGQNFDFLALGGTTTNDNGNYTVVVTNVFGAVTSAPAVLSVTQIFPPVITNAPMSLTVVAGSNATFSVGVSGTAPFSYQWVRSGVALPGNDAPTLTVTNVTAADAGSYFVQVFNSAGLATSQGQPATLTVLVPPTFLSEPQPATVLQGGFTNFVAHAVGSPAPAMAWFRDGVRLTNSAGYSGVSTTNLLVFSAQAGQAGNYVIVATNTAGAITSAPVALSVLLAPTIITQPTNVLLARTNYAAVLPATLSVAATGAAPLLYQWRFNGTNLPGETNATLLLTNVTRLHNGPYQAAVSNLAGFANSSLALVRVRVPQRVEPPVFIPGQPFRLRFTDDNGEQASPEDLARIEVQATTSLVGAATVWTTLTNGFTVVNGVLQFDDPASTNQIRRYYRVIER